MDMIYGGAGQGKLDYAKANYEQDRIIDHVLHEDRRTYRNGIHSLRPDRFVLQSRTLQLEESF